MKHLTTERGLRGWHLFCLQQQRDRAVPLAIDTAQLFQHTACSGCKTMHVQGIGGRGARTDRLCKAVPDHHVSFASLRSRMK